MQNNKSDYPKQDPEANLRIYLDSFFECGSARDVEDRLWTLLYLAISSQDMDSMTNIDRANIAFTYRKVANLVIFLEDYFKDIS